MMNKEKLEENKYWIKRLVDEGLSDVSKDNMDNYLKLGEVSARIDDIRKEVYNERELTVPSCVQEIYALIEYPELYTDTKTGKPINDDFVHEMIINNIDSLANLLGVDLEDDWLMEELEKRKQTIDIDDLFS